MTSIKLRTNACAIVLFGAALLGAGTPFEAHAQGAPQTTADKPAAPAFSVVSIRVNSGGLVGQMFNVVRPTDDGITYINTSLYTVIKRAYGMANSPDKQFIGLPDWAKDTMFDIVAKVDEADLPAWKVLTPAQRTSALRSVLEDRFKMKAHQETKELPVYALVVDKGGPHLESADAEDISATGNGAKTNAMPARFLAAPPAGMRGCSRLMLNKWPIAALASTLTSVTGRTVLDKTQLMGLYNALEFYKPIMENPGMPECDAPTVFDVLKTQLGLRLDSETAPVPVLEIDHLEMPTEN